MNLPDRRIKQPKQWQRKRIPLRAVLLVAALAASGVAAIAWSGATSNSTEPSVETETVSQDAAAVASTQILLRYKLDINQSSINAALQAVGAQQANEINNLRVKVLKVPAAQRERIIEALSKNPYFEFVEADAVYQDTMTRPNDTLYSSQWYWPRVLADVAWDRSTGDPITVAVLDGGINFGHSEFVGKTVPGYDFVNNDSDPTDDNPTSGHGTAVSSLIAALTNNGSGIAAGCWSCKVMPLKTSNSQGSRLASNEAEAIQYAADRGVKVINISGSGAGTAGEQTYKTAIDYATSKGSLVVVAAGNTGLEESRTPASIDNTISVAATTITDQLTSYSTYGQHVDIAAPGDVKAASYSGSEYRDVGGTSFSSPLVSSAAALLWSKFPNATATTIRTALTSTADPCCNGKINGGRINMAKAYAYLVGNGTVADKTAPALTVTAPAANASVSGTYAITGTASDNVAVSKVDAQIAENANPVAVNVSGTTFSIGINSTSRPNGTYNVLISAYDSSGNKVSVTRSFVYNNSGTTPNPTPTPPSPTPPSPTPTPPSPTPGTKTGDLNGDNRVNLTDLSLLLSNWNKTSGPGDINKSGRIDLTDLSLLLGNWNK